MTRSTLVVASLLALLTAMRGPLACASTRPLAESSDDKTAGVIKYGQKDAPKKEKGNIRLAAYNLENMFDDKDDPTLTGDREDKDLTASKSQCNAIAKAIKELDADILCVQEVESEEALVWFRDTYLKGLGYEYARSLDAGYERGVEQGVLSRFPIKAVNGFPEESLTDVKRIGEGWTAIEEGTGPTKFARSPLRAVIDGPGEYELIVYSIHLKSGGKKENKAQREAEALQLREYVAADLVANPLANVAVLGDFNAMPSDRTYALMIDGSKNGDGAGTMDGAYDFRNRKRSRDELTTHVSGRTIDYIAMSKGLAADAVRDSFFVLGTPYPGDEQQKEVIKWIKAGYPKGEEPERHPKQGSDHYPIAIDLDPSSDKQSAN